MQNAHIDVCERTNRQAAKIANGEETERENQLLTWCTVASPACSRSRLVRGGLAETTTHPCGRRERSRLAIGASIKWRSWRLGGSTQSMRLRRSSCRQAG